MQKIVCEMCGNSDLIKQDGVFVCQFCGTKYTLEEARNLMIEGVVEVSGTVKIDASNELKNLKELAQRAANANDYEKAQQYYDQILLRDPSDWRNNFYAKYYKAMNCSIKTPDDITSIGHETDGVIKVVLEMIQNTITSPDELRKALEEFATQLVALSKALTFEGERAYWKIETAAGGFVHVGRQTYENWAYSIDVVRSMVYGAGENIVEMFGEEYGDVAVICWKGMLSSRIQHPVVLNYEEAYKIKYSKLIHMYDPSFPVYDPPPKPKESPSRSKINGCYIATAVYGSYNCPQVWVLRRFRDNTLAKSVFGRTLIKLYYFISPWLVRHFAHVKWIKNMWHCTLDLLVDKLKNNGVQDTQYTDE